MWKAKWYFPWYFPYALPIVYIQSWIRFCNYLGNDCSDQMENDNAIIVKENHKIDEKCQKLKGTFQLLE